MADEQKEIVKYEFQADLTDLEAKARRAEELARKADQGGDSAGFKAWRAHEKAQAEANRPYEEAKGLEAVAAATQKDSSATEELIQHKRGLISVVNMLGGAFGGLAGQLINLVALLTAAGAALAGWIAAAVGLTLLVNLFRNIAAAAKAAADEQDRLNAGVAEAQAVRGQRLATLPEQLEGYGARTEGTVRAAEEIEQKLGKEYGITGARATRAASLAAGAGWGVEDAARLAVGLGAGAQISTLADASRFRAEAEKSGEWGTFLQLAQVYRRDAAGREARAMANAPMVGGRAGFGEIAIAYRALKAQPGGLTASGLPEGMTFEGFAEVAGAPAQAAILKARLEAKPGDYETMQAYLRADELAQKYSWVANQVRKIRRIQTGQDEAARPETLNEPTPLITPTDVELLAMGFTPSFGQRPGLRAQSVVNNYNIVNQGTVYHDRDGPARQLESKFNFSIGEIDVKAPH